MSDETKPPRKTGGDVVLTAARIRRDGQSRVRIDPAATFDLQLADETEARALAKLPGALSMTGAGGELVPISAGDFKAPETFRNTVDDPNYVTASASHERLELANDAQVLNSGLDVADSVRAQDSVARQMAHQSAALHRLMMKATAEVNRSIDRMQGVIARDVLELHNLHVTRMAGAVARLASAHTDLALALHRIRTGARQMVVVKYLQQVQAHKAVVTGKVAARGAGRRGRGKNSK